MEFIASLIELHALRAQWNALWHGDYGVGLFAPRYDAAAGGVLDALCGAALELDCDCVDLQQLRVTLPLGRAR
jgi:hypothetical protein